MKTAFEALHDLALVVYALALILALKIAKDYF